MSYIGIGSPIPDISSLPGQTGGEVEVDLSYTSASACTADSDLTPTFSPAGGSFASSSPSNLVVNSSTGVIDISASTAGSYTITYTVEGVPSSFAFTLSQTNASSFSYSSSSFEKTGIATPTITGVSGGTFAAPSGLSINNSTGVIDLAASTVGTYTVSYTSPGVCGTISTFQLSIEAVDRTLANTFSMSFDGTNYMVSDIDGTSLTSLSISLWFKIDSIPPLGAGAAETFLSWTNNAAMSGNYYHFIYLQFRKNSWQTDYRITQQGTVTTAQLETNVIAESDLLKWHHLALVRKNSNTTWTMYLDGVAQDTYNDNGSPINQVRAKQIYIGKQYQFGFNGLIDEVAIFDYDLTSQQVQEIYNLTNNNTGKTANLNKLEYATTNPIAWYRMGD